MPFQGLTTAGVEPAMDMTSSRSLPVQSRNIVDHDSGEEHRLLLLFMYHQRTFVEMRYNKPPRCLPD